MTDDEVLRLIEAVGVNLDGLMVHLRAHIGEASYVRQRQLEMGADIIRDGMMWLARAVKNAS